MKYAIFIGVALIIGGCATANPHTETYKQRWAKICVEKPAFCKHPNQNVRRDLDGRIYIGQ